MRLYRLGSRAYPLWDGGGSAIFGGRWNPVGVAVIYASGSLALAMLERLAQRRNLADTLLVEAVVPDDIAVEDMFASPPKNWQAPDSNDAAEAGEVWVNSMRTALLRVPSALVPREPNYLVNPAHPDAARILVGVPEPLEWDARLFGIPPP